MLVVRASDLGAMRITGADRQSWLNGLVTCDVASLAVGGAAYGLAVTQKGRILADVVVLLEPEAILLAIPRSRETDLASSFDKYLIMEDVSVEVVPDVSIFHVHGPLAPEVVGPARAAGGLTASVDFSGLGGALIVAGEATREAVETALGDVLREVDGAWGDENGWEAFRLERAVPRFGKDFDATTYPQEASLEKRAVSFQKGCYLGQEVVCMLEMRGHVKRKLVPIVLTGSQLVPAPGTEVTDSEGTKLGVVTSAAISPTLGATVGLAMLKASKADARTPLKIAGEDAAVAEGPL